MAKALILRAITGTQAGQRHMLTNRSSTIGTASTNDVVLHDRLLTPRHIEIRQALERWFVVPLATGSQGIALNGMPIGGQSRLNPGDTLTLGSVTYAVDLEEVAERVVGTPAASSSHGVPRLGEYFLRRGLLTGEQITKVAERQAQLQRDGSRLQFGQVAYDMGFINRSQLDAALADQRSDFNDRFY